ncbi:WD40-repeat-containing domain protein [Fimicolochytrium jonesii]|uniref:WD40-repeat-containing domain protein n=1 Tax=Fimicolochytrium jonesii TaxID=1396493 RepID=UPI0022FEDC70|nr:WD40-repeat-containing domain protein [Fimicolochytrium jonesii]KAI8823995.1 WD40-repeat-containing domain protein [Fimicolochytrium jonesii]
MMRFRTTGFNGYAVQYSPFFENRLACASASNFGIVGNGRLWVLGIGAGPEGIECEKVYDTQDGLYDLAWSEVHENQLVTSSGDGSIKLWDVTLPDFPIRNWAEHTREVFTVNWNLVDKSTFVTGSWDNTIKLWSPETPHSLATYTEHTHCIYQTHFSPHTPTTLASVSGDQTLKLWDTRSPHKSTHTIHAHNAEILALDWNKYIPNTLVTGSVDRCCKVWDLRFMDREIILLQGHEYAVRNAKWSPHHANVLASVGYDMTMRVWDTDRAKGGRDPARGCVWVHEGHTEFVVGVDWSMWGKGVVATCAWDEWVNVVGVPGIA